MYNGWSNWNASKIGFRSYGCGGSGEPTSRDVVHSFWVPRLAGKLDAVPGHVNVLRLEAPTPGTYVGQSAEFSGIGYRDHVFTVRAHDAASWTRFLSERSP